MIYLNNKLYKLDITKTKIFFLINLLLLDIFYLQYICGYKINYLYKKKSKIIHIQHYSNNNSNINSLLGKSNNYNFFFLNKEGKLKTCQHYGILIYNYPFEKPKYGNIGDYIQSLAALQYLPKNCTPLFIDRDNIENYNLSNHIVIFMNGWNIIQKGNRRTSNFLLPIYLSYHINNGENIDNITINNLKKYEPIGCRDIYTKTILKKNGIDAFFSSCLTTTLDIDYTNINNERTNEIIFIDYQFGQYPKADKYIKSLKGYNFINITHITHMYKLSKYSQLERFQYAKKLLDRYAKAKLVISTRIHGALPCLALRTPIIFINKKYDIRYPGLYELLNTIGINSEGKFQINVKLDNNNLVVNPKKYLKYSQNLKRIIKNKLNIKNLK